jgi:hypothetical protein
LVSWGHDGDIYSSPYVPLLTIIGLEGPTHDTDPDPDPGRDPAPTLRFHHTSNTTTSKKIVMAYYKKNGTFRVWFVRKYGEHRIQHNSSV